MVPLIAIEEFAKALEDERWDGLVLIQGPGSFDVPDPIFKLLNYAGSVDALLGVKTRLLVSPSVPGGRLVWLQQAL